MSNIFIFEKDVTEFTNIGLGVLTPSSCIVNEELNGIYELQLTHLYDDRKKYEWLQNERIILANTPTGYQPFRIYRITPTLDSITVNARHIFYDLLDNYISSLNTSGIATDVLNNIKNNFNYSTNFKFETNINKSGNVIIEKENPVSAILGSDEENPKFIQSFGGEILRDKLNIKILENLGSDKGFTIRYGKNLLGLKIDEDYSNTYTRCYAYGKDGISVVVDSENINNYLQPKIISQDFGDIDNISNLTQKAKEFLLTVDKPNVNIEVNFLLLSQTKEYEHFKFLEDIKLGDIVTIYNKKMNFSKKAKVISYTYNCISNSFESVILGDFLNILTDAISNNNSRLNSVSNTSSNALNDATSALNQVASAQSEINNINEILKQKQNITDEKLLTANKTIVGAINEILEKLKSLEEK